MISIKFQLDRSTQCTWMMMDEIAHQLVKSILMAVDGSDHDLSTPMCEFEFKHVKGGE